MISCISQKIDLEIHKIINVCVIYYQEVLYMYIHIYSLALPGMPIGTPGMPGEKEEPFIIYQLVDGKSSVFMTI